MMIKKIYRSILISVFLINYSSIFCQNVNDSIMPYYSKLYDSIRISKDNIVSKKIVKKKHINGNVKELHIELIKFSTDSNLVPKRNPYIRYVIGQCTKFYSNKKIKDIADYNIENQGNFPNKRYYKNGNLKSEGNYLNYKKTGFWKYYNKKGELKKEKNFGD